MSAVWILCFDDDCYEPTEEVREVEREGMRKERSGKEREGGREGGSEKGRE